MAQLRQDYDEFTARDAEILLVCPENHAKVQDYWEEHQLPFVGMADPDHWVAKLYGQQVRLLKLGRMPALVVVDKQGKVHYHHRGNSMQDIPSNERILALLDELK